MKSKLTGDGSLNILFAVCAIIILIAHTARWFGPSAGEPAQGPSQFWSIVRTQGELIGNASAPILIVEFGDYQCPACRVFHHRLDSLKSRFDSTTIALRYVQFPLPQHRWSKGASEAAICAADQQKFGAYHRLLFENWDSLPFERLVSIGLQAGIDTVRFVSCLDRSDSSETLRRDVKLAIDVGARRTPTVFINGLRFNGLLSLTALDSLVSDFLKQGDQK